MEISKTVAVLIPTFRPDKKFARLLQMLQKQTYPMNQIIVMNTEEACWNHKGYEGIRCLEVHHVKRYEFDHGKTRHMGMGYVKTDVCICMTQDAVPSDIYLIEKLVAALYQDSGYPIAAASARQLPEKDCHTIERYTRSFNYPVTSRIKTREDLKELGIKTYFSSNVCTAYNMNIYRELGGFIQKTIFNEDMIFAGQAILNGYAVAYEAEAKVIHSHNYSSLQQLHRNFDLAVSQAEHPEIFEGLASEGEGIRLIKKTAAYLIKQKKVWLLPELVIKSGFKYIGYLLGKHYRILPKSMVKALTMNQNYWR